MLPTRSIPRRGRIAPASRRHVMHTASFSCCGPGSFFGRRGFGRGREGFGPGPEGFGWRYFMGRGGHCGGDGGSEGGGGGFGVRRPLRFLAYKLGLDERPV